MSGTRAQVVIGVAVLILSAAFLLVGVYFAQLQGLLFQNGANSLQLFANNIAAVDNALYTAPSSMSITLAGNNSMCTWSSAIDAYDCAGGSKVYNISYASGPTLDAGTNMFSLATCVMVTVGPKIKLKAFSEVGSEAELEGLQTLLELGQANAKTEEEAAQFAAGLKNIQSIKGSKTALSILNKEQKASKTFTFNALLSWGDRQNSFLGSLATGIAKVGLFTSKHPIVRSLLTNIGAYTATFWLGEAVGSLDSNITKGIVLPQDPTIPAFTTSSQRLAGEILSTYITGEPILSPTDAALSMQTLQYSQLLSSISDIQYVQNSVAAYNAIQSAAGEAVLQQNIFNEIAAYSSGGGSFNPYSTPVSGAEIDNNSNSITLSSPNSFAGSTTLTSPSDFVTSLPFLLARKSLVVYGQTASCLGTMPQSINLNNALSTSLDIYGQALSALNIYSKTNVVNQLGTYFLGYGGQVYINGQSNGRPTAVGAPVITDQSDLCELVKTSSQPGTNLQTMILPLNNGDITLSVSQGLFNTMCSQNDVLYPKPVSDFINKILSATSSPKNVSILLPPQYAIGITNSSTSSSICLYSVALDQTGSPLVSGSGSSLTEYGLPLSCFNISQLTSGKEHLNFTAGTPSGMSLSTIGQSTFFLNNESTIGFSIPPTSYVNGNFISGPTMQIKNTEGVNSPMLNLASSLIGRFIDDSTFQNIINGAKTSIFSGIMNSIISSLSNPVQNSSYYPTEYTNITFKVSSTSGDININLASNDLIFGVYPNNYNSYGGTYGSAG